MIPPNKSAGCAIQNAVQTPAPQSPPKGEWKIQKLISVVIAVPAHDADSPDAAAKFADEIAQGLPLEVRLGDIVLPFRFIN